MLANSLGRTIKVLGLSLWVILGVTLGQTIAGILIVSLPKLVNSTIETTIAAALGYVFAIAITVILPLIIRKKKPNFTLLGIDRLPSWSDIGLGILALLP